MRKIAILLIMLLFGGCGYTTGSLLLSDYKTLHVENFSNRIDISTEMTDRARYQTYRAGMETDITNAIIERFIVEGNLREASRKNADLILSGELIDYTLTPLRYDASDNVDEYRVKVTVNIQVNDKDGELLWEEKNFSGESTYLTTGSGAKTEDTARDNAIEDLAERVVERTIENW